MRRDLTKAEAVGTLQGHFDNSAFAQGRESDEGREINSAFLRGRYDMWGETQLVHEDSESSGSGKEVLWRCF
jgi:hypothetical protein